jgi:hypothetical protein
MREVVALFDTRMEAQRAVDDLLMMGYDATKVGFMNRQRDIDVDPDTDVDTGTAAGEGSKGAAGGAVGGAAVGAGGALLASAGLALIPGIGPFLAAGTLAGTLAATAAGAAGGAVLGGAVGAIYGASKDDTQSTYYREGIDRGGALVTVNVNEGQESAVADTLRAAGAKNVDVHGGGGWVK